MEYMTKKEYEEKKAAIKKEETKYDKRGVYSYAAAIGLLIATATLANTTPFKVLGFSSTVGLVFYTFLGPVRKRNLAHNKLRQLKEQRLSELEQRVDEE